MTRGEDSARPAVRGALRCDDTRPEVVRVTLDGGPSGGQLDTATVSELLTALTRAESRPGTRMFVLTAAGASFCTGLDLSRIDDGSWRNAVSAIGGLLDRLVESPLITVAVVDGAAVGGGVGLAAACDYVIAGPGASFRMTEVLVGLVPALVLPVVARRVGSHRAFALAATARRLAAEEATAVGLADLRSAEPERSVRDLIRLFRTTDPGAIRTLKRYYRQLTLPHPLAGESVFHALHERLSDADSRGRRQEFRRAGLIP